MAVNELEVYKDFKALLKKSDIPSTKDVGVILAALIKNVSVALAKSRADMADKVEDWDRIGGDIKSELADAKKKMGALVADTNKKSTNEWYKALNAECYKLERAISAIPPFNPDTLETKWTSVIHELHAKLDAIKPFILVPFDVRDALESIDQEEEKLDFTAIRGSQKILEDIKKKSGMQMFGSKGIELSIDGVSKGNSQYINIIGGTGITLSYADVGQRRDITISLSGPGGMSVLPVTGTIDDSNMAFTVASLPILVIINGASYASTGGPITWAWVAGTLTTSSPIGTGGNIYALG